MLLALAAAPLRADEAATPLSQRERAFHLLRRFSLGATPELVDEVERVGVDRWLDMQVAGKVEEPAALTARLRALGSVALPCGDIVARYVLPIPSSAGPEERALRQRLRDLPPRELADSVVLRAVLGARQVEEVAADFLRNHFCVAIDKGNARYYATAYEREAIRAHAFGRFGDLLTAVAHHPAMLVYLDNAVSRRPATKAELKAVEMRVRFATGSKERGIEASDIAGQRGLNENYARELLELHTLGVDNGYTQTDVENVALAFTGWTVSAAHAFEFRDEMHAGGEKHFLGRVLRNPKNPEAEAQRILELLATHKGTARFLAWKLCRHFVRDDPPEDLVDRIAAVFLERRGDLAEVYRAIARDPAFYARESYGTKFKRPFEFVASALRVTRAEIGPLDGIHAALRRMGEPLYLCADPTGYYDQAEAWRDPGVFAARWKFAMDLVTGRIAGVKVPPALYADLERHPPEAWPGLLVPRLLPGGVGDRTRGAIELMVFGHLKANPRPAVAELAPRIAAMILGSPEFQQQ